MSQHEKILNLLDSGEWVCTSRMYADYIADPRTRLAELKKKGYVLEWRWCKTHDFHDGGSKEWRLVEKPRLEPDFASREVLKPYRGSSQLVKDFLNKDWHKKPVEANKTLF